jgi:hypothetical protein
MEDTGYDIMKIVDCFSVFREMVGWLVHVQVQQGVTLSFYIPYGTTSYSAVLLV